MSNLPILAAALGVASHLGYFIHGEHHKSGPRILGAFLSVPFIIYLWKWFEGDVTTGGAIAAAIVGSISYFAALSASILSYRVFFHPLRHFPGPFSARFSKLVHAARLIPKSDNFVQADQLHKKYGDFVRVGPNELAIIDPDAISAIHGAGSTCTKAAWYDVIGVYPSLHLTRDRAVHDKRRKVWDQAFSMKSLRNYNARLVKYVDQLVAQLDNLEGKRVNAHRWMGYYSFDVMGDLAFGKSFNMLTSGEQHSTLKILVEGMYLLGIFTPIAWIFPILLTIPGAAKDQKVFIKFNEDQADERRKNIPDVPDITSWLIDAEENNPDPIHKNKTWLAGDTGLIIIAGSDTTASTLTFLMYHLARDPSIAAKLREELSTTEPDDSKYLAAVINETLRMHPPTPSGVLRLTPPEGLRIGDKFIPGNVTVSMPFWSLGRLESAFTNPNEFIPERWTTSPELVKNKNAFMPFSTGPYSCVGKQLALLSLRTVVARLVQHFDFNFAEGETGKGLLEESRDVFTMEIAPLYLKFTRRQ